MYKGPTTAIQRVIATAEQKRTLNQPMRYPRGRATGKPARPTRNTSSR